MGARCTLSAAKPQVVSTFMSSCSLPHPFESLLQSVQVSCASGNDSSFAYILIQRVVWKPDVQVGPFHVGLILSACTQQFTVEARPTFWQFELFPYTTTHVMHIRHLLIGELGFGRASVRHSSEPPLNGGVIARFDCERASTTEYTQSPIFFAACSFPSNRIISARSRPWKKCFARSHFGQGGRDPWWDIRWRQ